VQGVIQSIARTIHLYAVLSGGKAGLKLCCSGSRPKPLNLRQRNNHAIWSPLVSGSQTGRESIDQRPQHTCTILAMRQTSHIHGLCWQQSSKCDQRQTAAFNKATASKRPV